MTVCIKEPWPFKNGRVGEEHEPTRKTEVSCVSGDVLSIQLGSYSALGS